MLAIDTDIDTHRPIGYLFRIGLADMFDQPGAATITFVLNVPGWYHQKFLSMCFLVDAYCYFV